MKVQMDTEALNLLKRAGLNEYESKVYLGLLNYGSTSASNISDIASIPRPRTYDVLSKLEKKGFVTMQPGRPTKFAASPVNEAFKSLERHKTRKHLKKIDELKDIENRLRKKSKTAVIKEDKTDELWMLSNFTNIKSKIETLIEGAQDTVVIAGNEDGIDRKLKAFKESLKIAKQNGAAVKVVSPNKADHEFEDVIADPHRMIIADDNVVFFLNDGSDPKQDKGVWIKSDFVSSNLKKMLWLQTIVCFKNTLQIMSWIFYLF